MLPPFLSWHFYSFCTLLHSYFSLFHILLSNKINTNKEQEMSDCLVIKPFVIFEGSQIWGREERCCFHLWNWQLSSQRNLESHVFNVNFRQCKLWNSPPQSYAESLQSKPIENKWSYADITLHRTALFGFGIEKPVWSTQIKSNAKSYPII